MKSPFSKRRNSAAGRSAGAAVSLAARSMVEALEARQMLSVSVNSTGTLLINGTSGDDMITVSPDTTVKGMLRVSVNGLLNGVDSYGLKRININGLEGDDQILIDQSTGVISLPVNVAGGSGDDTITGGSGDDLLQGGRGNDLLRGSAGRDRLEGHAGNDRMYGGSGRDTLDGGAGADGVYTGGYRREQVVADPADTVDRSEPHMVPASHVKTTPRPNFFNANVVGLTPAQVRTAYGIDSLGLTGAGQTIAIVDAFLAPTVRQDLKSFSAEFGLPAPTPDNFQIYYATKVKPNYDSGWAGETALDVQWAHAIAPDAKIILVEAASNSNDDLAHAIDRAVELLQPTGGVLSMSFGRTELFIDPLESLHYHNPSTRNVSFFASTGDSGADVSHPAVFPDVTAVGGTFLNVDASGNLITPEEGWTGAGGGISTLFPRPDFQAGVTIEGQPLGNRRAVPDVAFLADPRSGVAVYNTSPDVIGFTGWQQVGGTSLAAPMWAAYTALINQRRAQLGKGPIGSSLNTALYQAAAQDYSANFNDITSGSNPYPAVPGFDLVTGLGTPKPALVEALAQTNLNVGAGANVTFEAARLRLEALPGDTSDSRVYFFGGTGFATNQGPGVWDLQLIPNARSGVSISLDGPLTQDGTRLSTLGTVDIVIDKDHSQSYTLKVVARETRGGLVGEFYAVSKRGKIIYQGDKPLFYATFQTA